MSTARVVDNTITGFTGTAVAGLKTVNVLSVADQPNLHKTVLQGAATDTEGPTFLLGPTGTKGIPTIVIGGFTGPA
jgi:hypothetical protein